MLGWAPDTPLGGGLKRLTVGLLELSLSKCEFISTDAELFHPALGNDGLESWLFFGPLRVMCVDSRVSFVGVRWDP